MFYSKNLYYCFVLKILMWKNLLREAISSDFLKFTTDKEICNSIDFLNNESINNRVTFYINPLTP